MPNNTTPKYKIGQKVYIIISSHWGDIGKIVKTEIICIVATQGDEGTVYSYKVKESSPSLWSMYSPMEVNDEDIYETKEDIIKDLP